VGEGPPQDDRIGELKDEAVRTPADSALGPYAAIQTSSRPSRTHGMRTGPAGVVIVPPSASVLIVAIASSSWASVVGLRPSTRCAESPRPIPQMVRLPNMSLSVANTEAVTVGSRVAGLVTRGPTVIRSVAERIWEWMT
jgi:hypothetical protein